MSLITVVGRWLGGHYYQDDKEHLIQYHHEHIAVLEQKIAIARAKTKDYGDRLDALTTAYETLEVKYNNVTDQRPRSTSKTKATTTRKKNQSSRKTNKKSTAKK